MSAKSSKKPSPKQPVPRAKAHIEEDFGRLIAQVGQAQYQVSVYQEEVTRMNQQLRSLNYEAAARNNLDQAEAKLAAETKAVTEAKEEATNA